MLKVSHICAIALLTWLPGIVAAAVDTLAWPQTLPVYDHIVIVVEENKDFEQIFGGKFNAPYLKQLAAEGASISRMFGEEHPSEGNYFWLFSGSNQKSALLTWCRAPPTTLLTIRPGRAMCPQRKQKALTRVAKKWHSPRSAL